MNWNIRILENTKTGEKIRYDKGDSTGEGHESEDHYHRYNPNVPKGRAGDKFRYLDCDGTPVSKGTDKAHLYPPEGITWE